MIPYAVPQEWAAAFDAAFAGIRYQTRFTTGPKPNAVGLFAEAGETDWATDPNPEPLAVAARRCDFTIASPPRSVRIAPPRCLTGLPSSEDPAPCGLPCSTATFHGDDYRCTLFTVDEEATGRSDPLLAVAPQCIEVPRITVGSRITRPDTDEPMAFVESAGRGSSGTVGGEGHYFDGLGWPSVHDGSDERMTDTSTALGTAYGQPMNVVGLVRAAQ